MTIDSDSIRRTETSSDRRTEKAIESEIIERETEAFLSRGGKIQEIPDGVSGLDLGVVISKGRSVWKNQADALWRLKYPTGQSDDNSRD